MKEAYHDEEIGSEINQGKEVVLSWYPEAQVTAIAQSLDSDTITVTTQMATFSSSGPVLSQPTAISLCFIKPAWKAAFVSGFWDGNLYGYVGKYMANNKKLCYDTSRYPHLVVKATLIHQLSPHLFTLLSPFTQGENLACPKSPKNPP